MRKNNKKGISPLIATVLIIGFTIVLAALVITWGTKLFKTTVEETESASKMALACTTGLKLDVIKAVKDDNAGTLKVTLRNNNQDTQIDGFRFVFKHSTPDVGPDQVKKEEATDVLIFPVQKEYVFDATLITDEETQTALVPGDVESVDIYPEFKMEGKGLKSCDTPINTKF